MRLEGWGPEEQAPHPPGDVPEPTVGGIQAQRRGEVERMGGRVRGWADQSQGVSREMRNGPQHP